MLLNPRPTTCLTIGLINFQLCAHIEVGCILAVYRLISLELPTATCSCKFTDEHRQFCETNIQLISSIALCTGYGGNVVNVFGYVA